MEGHVLVSSNKLKILLQLLCFVFFFADIDECSGSQICSHGCVNLPGSYKCTCPTGLFLGSDRQTCTGKGVGG